MITRKEYLKNSNLHHQYYLEIAKEIGISVPKDMLEKCKKALEKGDESLNSIPLKEWDMWVNNSTLIF